MISFAFKDTVSASELFCLLDKMALDTSKDIHSDKIFHTILRSEEKERISLANVINVTARNSERQLVGYLKIITDNVYFYYIVDVMVDPDFQGNGIARSLLNITKDSVCASGFIKVLVNSIPGLETFYEEFGFSRNISTMMALRGEDYI